MVEIRNLSAGYEAADVLKTVSASFPEGKLTVILGPNGCGKSTLLKTLVGLTPKVKGEIFVDGVEKRAMNSVEIARKIAYLPQNKRPPEMTVRQLVLHGRFPYLSYPRRYRREDVAAAEQAIARMGLTRLADQLLTSLSGGTQQKCYIAMALAQDSPTVLMDEPLSFLDIAHQLKLLELAKELAAGGKTMVLVLHDLALALRYADRVLLMEQGEIRAAGTPEQILQSKKLEQVFGVQVKAEKIDGKPCFLFEEM